MIDRCRSLASDKSKDIRSTNIVAGRAVADVVRTSLGPKGMDKMVSNFWLIFFKISDC
jgi:chaperonin GroEL (HSP60 family)